MNREIILEIDDTLYQKSLGIDTVIAEEGSESITEELGCWINDINDRDILWMVVENIPRNDWGTTILSNSGISRLEYSTNFTRKVQMMKCMKTITYWF